MTDNDSLGEYLVRQTIKMGRQYTEMFEVLDGVNPGDKVITSSYESFGDVQKLMLTK